MNLSDPDDALYDLDPDELDKIYFGLRDMRDNAMGREEDLYTSLICVTNSLLNLINYLRKQRCNTPQK